MNEQPRMPREEPMDIPDGAGAQIVAEVQDADLVGPADGEEVIDAYAVIAEVRPLPVTAPVALPAVQAAAAAATGFVAGAATLALCRRFGARRVRRARAAPGRAVDLPIVGTRTFLVDVHLIAKPGE